MPAQIIPHPSSDPGAAVLTRQEEIIEKGMRPKAVVSIPSDCGFACYACNEYGDIVMCWHCGYFFCHLCKPVRAHQR